MKRPVWVAAVNVALVLVLLLAAELALRTFFPVYPVGDPAVFEYDEELGYVLKQEQHRFKTTDYQSETVTNRLGTANFQETFSPALPTIFAVGDSYTKGSGVPADASYPFQLDLLLNSSPLYQPRFNVVNLGVPGYSGRQNVLRLTRYIEEIGTPDYILYMGSDNDAEEDLLFERGARHTHLVDGSPKWGVLVGPLQWLTTDLQLGLRLKLGIARLRQAWPGFAAANAAAGGATPVAQLQQGNLEHLAGMAQRDGIALIVTWSNSGASYDWLRSWTRGKAVRFADWRVHTEAVRRLKNRLPLANAHQGRHHRTWVNAMIARAFALEIERLQAGVESAPQRVVE